MKVSDVLNINEELKHIIDDKTCDIPAATKFRLLSVMKSFESTVANFEKVRIDAIKKYGEEDEETGNYIIKKENTEAIENFNNELNDVVDAEVEIQFQKIKMEEIFDKNIPSDNLVRLFSIIEN